jgi:hypothetical protein
VLYKDICMFGNHFPEGGDPWLSDSAFFC